MAPAHGQVSHSVENVFRHMQDLGRIGSIKVRVFSHFRLNLILIIAILFPICPHSDKDIKTMRELRLSVFIFFMLVGSTELGFTQQLCEAIIRSANYDEFSQTSKEQRYQLQRANFCIAEYSKADQSQQAQISASYGLFSGGAGATNTNISETQRNVCQNHYGEFWFNQEGFSDQRIVSLAAMDTVKACIDAFGKSLTVEPTFGEDESSVVIAIHWGGLGNLTLNRVIHSNEYVHCSIDGADVDNLKGKSTIIEASSSKAVSCSRSKITERIAGENVSCYPPAQIAIDTKAAVVPINLFRHCDTDYLISKAQEVEKKVSTLEARLKTQEDRNSKLDCRQDSASSPVSGYPRVEVKVLQPGYKVVGGGCSVSNSDAPGSHPVNHNPPIIVNHPTPDGWLCRGGDPPNIPESWSITATVISCKSVE